MAVPSSSEEFQVARCHTSRPRPLRFVQKPQPLAGGRVDEVYGRKGLARIIPRVPRISARNLPAHSAEGRPPEDFPGLQGEPATVRSPQSVDRAGHRADSPQERAREPGTGRAGLRVDLCGHTPPEACAPPEERARGGGLGSPRMICRCLMRLMSPGGWYAAVLGHSLDADAHGNDGGGPGGGGGACGSPARWFPLIWGRGRGSGGRVLALPRPRPRPPALERNAAPPQRAREGRPVGPGTALLLAVEGPMPGTGYVLHKYRPDEIRDKRGPGRGAAREPRTAWGFLLVPTISPFPLPPGNPWTCGGGFCPLLSQHPPTLSKEP